VVRRRTGWPISSFNSPDSPPTTTTKTGSPLWLLPRLSSVRTWVLEVLWPRGTTSERVSRTPSRRPDPPQPHETTEQDGTDPLPQPSDNSRRSRQTVATEPLSEQEPTLLSRLDRRQLPLKEERWVFVLIPRFRSDPLDLPSNLLSLDSTVFLLLPSPTSTEPIPPPSVRLESPTPTPSRRDPSSRPSRILPACKPSEP